MSDPYAAKNRLNSNSALMSMMLDSGTIEQADAFFSAVRSEGGPSFDKASGLKTYYSIVAVPSELKLWLNVRDLQGWTEIDLKPLFANN